MYGFRLAFITSVLSVAIVLPALALDAPGIWQNDKIEGQQDKVWQNMAPENIKAAIESMPDVPGSRALTQLAKAILLGPITLPGDEAAEGSPKTDAQILSEKITAQRLQKLLEMGGINEAKLLADEVDTDQTLEPILMEQVALTLVASNTKQAACIDLLAYKSEAADKFAQLSAGPQAIIKDCLNEKTNSAPQKTFALGDLAGMDLWDSALKISSEHISQTASTNPLADYQKLSPFQQAMLIRSTAISPRLQWQFVAEALRHDYISVKQAQEIYSLVTLPKDKPSAQEIRLAAKGKPTFERLAMYYKTIASDKTNAAALTQNLAVSIVAAGATYDLYALLPFSGYFSANLDIHDMRQRSSFIAGLVQTINGDSITSPSGAITPKDAVWALAVLNADQSFKNDDFTLWSDTNMTMLSGIAPDLDYRLAQSLQSVIMDDNNASEYLSNYVNKKSLTASDNYVMHSELLLSKAESLGQDSSIGSVVTLLAQASNKASPDRLDPAGAVKMVRMLNDMGLTHTARKLSAEQLVFKMQPDAPMGNNKVTGEN